MKISLGDLRRLIRETLEVLPGWKPDDPRWEDLFYSKLRKREEIKTIGPVSGLPVTHESPLSNMGSIDRKGLRSDRIHFTIGWYDKPVFVSGPAVMYQILIPESFLNSRNVFPDDMFGMGPEGCKNFLEAEPVGGVVGKALGFSNRSGVLPKIWVQNKVVVNKPFHNP